MSGTENVDYDLYWRLYWAVLFVLIIATVLGLDLGLLYIGPNLLCLLPLFAALFVVDLHFPAIKFEFREYYHDHLSNEEYMLLLIETPIKEENEENGTKLEFVKYVSANVVAVAGFLFYITFWAQDLSSPNPEPKCYQAKVRKFAKLIDVIDFRLKPTQ